MKRHKELQSERRQQFAVLLKRTLDEACCRFEGSGEIQHDAIAPALKYSEAVDREFAALICAVLAYGRVSQIKASITRLLDPLGSSPTKALIQLTPDQLEKVTHGWKHRFNTQKDAYCLLYSLRQIYRDYRCLEQAIAPKPNESARDIIERMAEYISGNLPCPPNPSFWYLLPRPSKGSACKRLNLFLRWMVGQSEMDLSLWTSMRPSQLVIPVDTHVHRQALSLGLTKRKSNDWKTAEEITESLRELDPLDPTKYDFALCHLGIEGKILKRKDFVAGPLVRQ